MKYTVFALLGGFLGIVVAWVAMPGATPIDDAWTYVWQGIGAGLLAGLLVAKMTGRRSAGRPSG